MKRDILFLLGISIFLAWLPGCCGGRVGKWCKERADQGTNLQKNIDVARNHIRSSRTYDQFTFIGAFDSLWLADQVREVYADLYASKHGKSNEEKNIFLRRQIEENNHFISFYVLSAANIVIGEKDSQWTVFLKIGNHQFIPTECKAIDLSPEFKLIFGKKLNRFKSAYILRFNAKDIEDVSLIQPSTGSLHLVFRTVEKEVIHSWHIDSNGILKLEEPAVCA